MTARRRVVVTGLGVVCPVGRNRREFWGNLLEGRRGLERLRLFDASGCLSDLAGEAEPPCLSAGGEKTAGSRASRADRLCLAAAEEAIESAGLSRAELESFGVSLGSSAAGMLEAEAYCRDRIARGPDRAPVSQLLGLPNSAPADSVARLAGAGGPRLSNMTACASSAASIGFAADLIRSGDAPGMLAGGGDALCLLTYSGFNALRLLDANPCRPFDVSRHGITLGEGAAIMVLESRDRALARKAPLLGEFIDYGASCDAHHMTAPHPEGRGAALAMSRALDRSGLSAADIAHVNAHGTGTPLNDASEARAIASVFGERAGSVPVTATKSSVGHLLGGSGAIEAAALVMSLGASTAPPTAGWSCCDEGIDLAIVAGHPLHFDGEFGMSNSFGFGGTNVSLVFRRCA